MKILEFNEADNNDYEEFIINFQNNETFKQMSKLCKQYGYTLETAYYSKLSNTAEIEIVIAGDNKYLPEIIAPKSLKTDVWSVQVNNANGEHSFAEYERLILALEDAYRLIDELSQLDLSTLYVSTEY